MRTGNIRWLAGLLEGEGYFANRKVSKNQERFLIQLDMTDKDVVEKAAKIMGVKTVITIPADGTNRKKDLYRIYSYGKRGIAWMMTLHGLMGERRRQTIEGAILSWRARLEGRWAIGSWASGDKCKACGQGRTSKPVNCNEPKHKERYERNLRSH